MEYEWESETSSKTGSVAVGSGVDNVCACRYKSYGLSLFNALPTLC